MIRVLEGLIGLPSSVCGSKVMAMGGTLQVEVFLRFFGHLCLALDPNPLSHYFGSRFVRKLGRNPLL